jgi:hypothetical protein
MLLALGYACLKALQSWMTRLLFPASSTHQSLISDPISISTLASPNLSPIDPLPGKTNSTNTFIEFISRRIHSLFLMPRPRLGLICFITENTSPLPAKRFGAASAKCTVLIGVNDKTMLPPIFKTAQRSCCGLLFLNFCSNSNLGYWKRFMTPIRMEFWFFSWALASIYSVIPPFWSMFSFSHAMTKITCNRARQNLYLTPRATINQVSLSPKSALATTRQICLVCPTSTAAFGLVAAPPVITTKHSDSRYGVQPVRHSRLTFYLCGRNSRRHNALALPSSDGSRIEARVK